MFFICIMGDLVFYFFVVFVVLFDVLLVFFVCDFEEMMVVVLGVGLVVL